MQLYTCQDLGEITITAFRQPKGEPRQKLIKTQFGVNDLALGRMVNIAGTITEIDTVKRYQGKHEADIVVTMMPGIDASTATRALNHLLARVTKCLDRAIAQERAYATGATGFAISGEVKLHEYYS